MLRALSSEHEFTVFSVDFENPDPSRIRWVRIPAPRRPLALLFVAFHIIAPLYYWRFCRRNAVKFDLVQMIECNFSFGDLSYAHFCHRHYLRHFWRISRPMGIRRLLSWLDHRLHEMGERFVYSRVRTIVVPSRGLQKDIGRHYPDVIGRMRVIHNPIEHEKFEPGADFDRTAFRAELGFDCEETVLVFAALGHFERKGLPAVLQAISTLGRDDLKLIVVGGTREALSAYKALADRLRIGGQIQFVGNQNDVRPYFWAADAFVLASSYETFSLATYEAAAAGLPIIVAPTSGIEDILEDGINGFKIGTRPDEILPGLRAFLSLSRERRDHMSIRAKESARSNSIDSFLDLWRGVYRSLERPGDATLPQANRVAAVATARGNSK